MEVLEEELTVSLKLRQWAEVLADVQFLDAEGAPELIVGTREAVSAAIITAVQRRDAEEVQELWGL